jgi:hypothetical protein
MASESFTLETVDGELDVPKTDLMSLEVELDSELASMFRLRLALRQQRDGVWTYLDEERFRPWMPMRITGGFDTDTEERNSCPATLPTSNRIFHVTARNAVWKSGVWTGAC